MRDDAATVLGVVRSGPVPRGRGAGRAAAPSCPARTRRSRAPRGSRPSTAAAARRPSRTGPPPRRTARRARRGPPRRATAARPTRRAGSRAAGTAKYASLSSSLTVRRVPSTRTWRCREYHGNSSAQPRLAGEVLALARRVVGEEHQPAVEALEQHHPARRPARARRPWTAPSRWVAQLGGHRVVDPAPQHRERIGVEVGLVEPAERVLLAQLPQPAGSLGHRGQCHGGSDPGSQRGPTLDRLRVAVRHECPREPHTTKESA